MAEGLTAVNEPRCRPIIFSGPMVLAIRAGLKTQTRRLVRPRKGGTIQGPADGVVAAVERYGRDRLAADFVSCPYGAPGDRLWVRETWAQMNSRGTTLYLKPERANGTNIVYRADPSSDPEHLGEGFSWKPSIFMPRWASRLTLEVTTVRVERLKSISEKDARAEGVPRDTEACDHVRYGCAEIGCLGPTHKSSYCYAWCHMHGQDSWKANPWVWAITFRRIDAR